MPELPEVETLCRQLQKKITGQKIASTTVYDDKLAHIRDLKGRIVTDVRRDGKMIEILLDNKESIFIHLRMSGRLLWLADTNRPKYGRWRMSFADANIYLVDPRRFATVKILKTKDIVGDKDIMLGFDQHAFLAKHGRRKTKVKSVIMDQNAITGIGNIYACEILHLAAVHPEKIAATLTPQEWRQIFSVAKKILKKAIQKRGTSISDWRDLDGCPGENQHELKVYGRAGQGCGHCGGIIRRIKLGGRGTYYCPDCQK